MVNSPVDLQFSQPWLNASSPVSLLFGETTAPVKKPEVGMLYSPAWQLNALKSKISAISWQKNSVGSYIKLAYNSLLLQSFNVLNGHNAADKQVRFRFVFTQQKLKGEHLVLPWRNSALKTNTVSIKFDSKPLKNIARSVCFNSSPNKNTLIKTLLWKKAKSLRIDRAVDWLAKSSLSEQLLTIRYGPAPLNLICYHKNNPKNGLVTLKFTEAAKNANSPLTMVLNPFQKICYWGNGGGLIRSSDDLPVLDRKIPISPQLKSSYVMQPTITCVRVSDNLEILITSFSYQTSRSQFAATCSVKFCSRIDFERAQNQLLKITINGYDFYTYIEKCSHNKAFNNVSYSATGRSRFAELSAPFARATSYTNAASKTLVGIMADIIQNTPWTIASNIVDYPVPALAFSYKSKNPAEALAICASAAGAMLSVDDNNQQITINPKWPVMPWATDSATCDVIINDSVILTHSTTDIINPSCNAVVVRGEQQGVAAKIKRAGSAGDLYASDVVDKLITDNQAARQRGSCELANTGNKEQSSIRTKIMTDLPPIKPGMLIGIQYQSLLYKATCDIATYSASVSSDGKVSVNQEITLLKNV